jgi:hypothetical protein
LGCFVGREEREKRRAGTNKIKEGKRRGEEGKSHTQAHHRYTKHTHSAEYNCVFPFLREN